MEEEKGIATEEREIYRALPKREQKRRRARNRGGGRRGEVGAMPVGKEERKEEKGLEEKTGFGPCQREKKSTE